MSPLYPYWFNRWLASRKLVSKLQLDMINCNKMEIMQINPPLATWNQKKSYCLWQPWGLSATLGWCYMISVAFLHENSRAMTKGWPSKAGPVFCFHSCFASFFWKALTQNEPAGCEASFEARFSVRILFESVHLSNKWSSGWNVAGYSVFTSVMGEKTTCGFQSKPVWSE